MTRWVFIRHAESEANAQGWLSGHQDVPLTARGRDQALALRGVVADLCPRLVLSSDLQRAAETARLACDGAFPITTSPHLRERCFGSWELRPIAQLRRSGEMERIHSWSERVPGGESRADLALRVATYLRDHARSAGPILVFSHGGVMRTTLGLLDGVARSELAYLKVLNATPQTRQASHATWAALVDALSQS